MVISINMSLDHGKDASPMENNNDDYIYFLKKYQINNFKDLF